jgi:predicted amino acid-binding ACT domain protein
MASVVARSSLWNQVKQIPMKYPMGFGVVLSGTKTSFSDLLVQKVVEQREEVDWRRNAAFASFGVFYLGGVQYTLYVTIFSRMFPNAASFAAKPLAQKVKDFKGMAGVVGQTFLDQCVHHPFMYFPAFYCTKEIVMADKPDIMRVLTEYRKNMSEDLAALWKIWVPCTIFNFAFMPMHLRIPFAAGVSLLWTCVLSTMRGGDVAVGEDMAGGAVTGSTYSLLKEGLDETFNTSPVEMDANLSHFNISAAGLQRPGLMAMLVRHLADQGGNVTHSKMMRLGQDFIMQMHIAVPPEQAEKLFKSLKSKTLTKELDIQVTKLKLRDYDKGHIKAVMGMRIHCVGLDK